MGANKFVDIHGAIVREEVGWLVDVDSFAEALKVVTNAAE